MKKEEKKMIKKVLENSKINNIHKYENEEARIIQKLLIQEILSEKAFICLPEFQMPNAAYAQIYNTYPLTKKGIEENEKNIYFKIRDSTVGKIIRDIMSAIVLIATILYSLKKFEIL